jgi:hypothetical protein
MFSIFFHGKDDKTVGTNTFLTIEWLNNKIQNYCNYGHVIGFTYTYHRRYVTDTYFLTIYFAIEKQKKFFLKVYLPNLAHEIDTNKEVVFYNKLANIMNNMSFADCASCGYLEENGLAYILLKDMSETHYSRLNIRNCSKEDLILLILKLAKIHAFWWDHNDLGVSIGKFLLKNEYEDYVKSLEKRFQIFKNKFKNRIDHDYIKAVALLIERSDIFFNRLNSRENITMIHGDANPFGNVLFPHNPKIDEILLIDWNAWGIQIGMKDVAHAIGLNFYPHQRKEFEDEILKLYHKTLVDNGVRNYSYDECLYDYKLCITTLLFSPITLLSWDISEGVWWPYCVKGYANYLDLNCKEIIN